MLEDGRYCPEILVQTRAIRSAVLALEDSILEEHMRHCVKGAIKARDDEDVERKIDELMDLFKRRS